MLHKHTAEPWMPNVMPYRATVVGISGVVAEVIENDIGKEEQAANTRRIVSCVNACAGIPDPADLRKQRDGLLYVLKTASARLETFGKASLVYRLINPSIAAAIADAEKQTT